MGALREVRQIRHHDRGVRDGLEVQHPGGHPQRILDRVGVGRVHVDDLHPEPGKDVGHQRARAAVDGLGRDDPVASAKLRRERGMDRGHAGGERETHRGAVELRERIRHRGRGGIAGPRIGVARSTVGKDIAELRGIVGLERHRLIDGHRVAALVDHGRLACDTDRARAKTALLLIVPGHRRTLHRASVKAGVWPGQPAVRRSAGRHAAVHRPRHAPHG